MTEHDKDRARNLGYAGIAGLAGCSTVGFVVFALLVGLWLDAQTGVRGLFTIGLLIISVPVSLLVMVWMALAMVKRIQTPPSPQTREDSTYTEED
jgi:MFS family permease